MSKCSNWVPFGLGLAAVGMSVAFIVTYAGMRSDLMDIPADQDCIAPSAPDKEDEVNMNERLLMLCNFGFGVWIVLAVTAVLAMFSGFYYKIAAISGLANCACSLIPLIVQTVYIAVYRYDYTGNTCA